jgi:O-acetyl-ADP-ribose deacetylase
MPLSIVRNNIIKMQVDVVVNAANNQLQAGSGVCGAIFQAADAAKLQSECNTIGFCKTGDAVITKGYNLPAKHIIHTVGPVWRDGNHNEKELLYNCYLNSLKLAVKHHLTSIAFPLISSGIFGYPKGQALHIATTAISEFLLAHDLDVILVVYDRKAFVISEKLFSSVEKYIDDNYVNERIISRSERLNEIYQIEQDMLLESSSNESKPDLEDVLNELDESFSERLIRLIDKKGRMDTDVYKHANIDRKLFSKIKNNKSYKPSKPTALAFAISLHLNLDETKDLLKSAGYMLSHSFKFDVVIEYFIIEENYNIFELNETLFKFGEPLLGV